MNAESQDVRMELDGKQRRIFVKAYEVLKKINFRKPSSQKWLIIQLVVEPREEGDTNWHFAHNFEPSDRFALKNFVKALDSFIDEKILKEGIGIDDQKAEGS